MTTHSDLPFENDRDYERYEARMEHEDLLLSQRVSWLLTSQAFLLSPYVILRNNHAPPAFSYVVIALGLASALLTYVSVAAGMHAMLRLKLAYDAHLAGIRPIAAFKPMFHLKRIDTRHSLLAPRGMIYCSLIAWTTLLGISLRLDIDIPRVGLLMAALAGFTLGALVSLYAYSIDKSATERIYRTGP